MFYKWMSKRSWENIVCRATISSTLSIWEDPTIRYKYRHASICCYALNNSSSLWKDKERSRSLARDESVRSGVVAVFLEWQWAHFKEFSNEIEIHNWVESWYVSFTGKIYFSRSLQPTASYIIRMLPITWIVYWLMFLNLKSCSWLIVVVCVINKSSMEISWDLKYNMIVAQISSSIGEKNFVAW